MSVEVTVTCKSRNCMQLRDPTFVNSLRLQQSE